MRREPSIHITESRLKNILKEAEVDGDIDDLVKFILIRASEYRLNTRKILVDTKKLTEKLTRAVRVDTDITNDMNKAILYVRKAKKHKALTTIRPGSKDYLALKQISENGKKFYQTYFHKSENRFDAFVTYIETYFEISKRFVLNFLAGNHDRICEAYEAKIAIAKDPYGEVTRKLLHLYNQKVIAQTGMLFVDYTKVPDQYLHFVQAAEICTQLRVNPEAYITSQFERFSYFNTIPEPKNLIGEKALMAIQKYIVKNPQHGKKAQLSQEKINRLKNIGKK